VRTQNVDEIEYVKPQLEAMGIHVVSLYDELDEIKSQFIILDSILGVIGAISLFVAALGIINTLIMSVMERRREIGIMRSVGARKKDVKIQFLTEAGIIGFFGSVLGLLLGWLITRVANIVFNSYILKDREEVVELFYFPWWLILGSILFAVIVGVASGLYPASKAARVDPVMALRHE